MTNRRPSVPVNYALKTSVAMGKVKDRSLPAQGGKAHLVLCASYGHGARPEGFPFPDANGWGCGGAGAEARKRAEGGGLVLPSAPMRLGDGKGCGPARALVGARGARASWPSSSSQRVCRPLSKRRGRRKAAQQGEVMLNAFQGAVGQGVTESPQGP